MSSSDTLYHRIIGTLEGGVKVSNAKQLKNWAWIVVGILQAQSIALSQIATHIPCPGRSKPNRVSPPFVAG